MIDKSKKFVSKNEKTIRKFYCECSINLSNFAIFVKIVENKIENFENHFENLKIIAIIMHANVYMINDVVFDSKNYNENYFFKNDIMIDVNDEFMIHFVFSKFVNKIFVIDKNK